MTTFWTLYRRELGSYFLSPIAYIVLFISALMLGLYLSFELSANMEFKHNSRAIIQMTSMNVVAIFLLFFQPALITMRTFSEEYKLGTIESLLTAPVREWEVVAAKFAGAWTFFMILWLPMLTNVVVVWAFSGNHMPPVWPLVGSTFLVYALLGAVFCSLGVLTSAMTRNQILAALTCFFLTFMLLFIGLVSVLYYDPLLRDIMGAFSPLLQIYNFSNGIVDTRPIVFYLSTTVLALFLALRLLQARRHRA
ncbi:MAG: ABC transporter permease [Verrucomicrobiota bacterium]